MLLFSIAVIAWICVSFAAALAISGFIVSSDRLWIAKVALGIPSPRNSGAMSEEASVECDGEGVFEPSVS